MFALALAGKNYGLRSIRVSSVRMTMDFYNLLNPHRPRTIVYGLQTKTHFFQSHDLLISAIKISLLGKFWSEIPTVYFSLYKQSTLPGHPHHRHLPNWEHQCPVSWVLVPPIILINTLWVKFAPLGALRNSWEKSFTFKTKRHKVLIILISTTATGSLGRLRFLSMRLGLWLVGLLLQCGCWWGLGCSSG